jgi:nickel-dependent lactate racemase
MIFSLPYGSKTIQIDLPDSLQADLIYPPEITGSDDPSQCAADALDHPVDHHPLTDYSAARSVAIAVNDKTRPVPHFFLLPPLLARLAKMGIPDTNIQFFIATGTHTPMLSAEFPLVLSPEILSRYSVVSHNCDDDTRLIDLGATSRGTPVFINRKYYEADLKISIGNIEPHHFAGFSGGAKSVSIGLAGRQTITSNHSFLTNPYSSTNSYNQNPLRMDIEEIGELAGINFCVNAIMNSHKQIVYVLAGNPRSVMEHGIPLSRQVCNVPVRQKYDLVLVSTGGAPKDINFYQAQKAITHAAMLTRDGGTIILLAACPDGHGSVPYFEFMKTVASPQEAIEKFNRQAFSIGPHKAFLTSRILSRVKIYLASEMPPEIVKILQLNPVRIEDIPHLPEVNRSGICCAVMPYGVMSIPDLI